MLLPQILALTLALVPAFTDAAIFPKDSKVKMLDPKSFKKVMKRNETSLVAFVAPWCGHCQRMTPEYIKAAKKLSPLIPLYAVDCDEETNKGLCSAQGVTGFPTVKLFPRGASKPPKVYNSGERTSKAISAFAAENVPNNLRRFSKAGDIPAWVEEKISKPRAILLNSAKTVPLLWQVLSNTFGKDIEFANIHLDSKKSAAIAIGLNLDELAERGEGSKVVVWGAELSEPFIWQSANKKEALSQFFRDVIAGKMEQELKKGDSETAGETERPTDEL